MNDRIGARIFWYWGKYDPEGTPGKHLLVYHLLDVAAVGAVLLDRHPTLLGRFAAMTGLGRDPSRKWLLWLLALHDIGKFSAAFQRLRTGLFPEVLSDCYRYTERHDTLGYLLWKEQLLGQVFPWLEPYSPFEDGLLTLLRASAGHHGKPPAEVDGCEKWFRPQDIEAARDFSAWTSEFFFGKSCPPPMAPDDEYQLRDDIAAASWSLAGFTVLCDWIGSNRRWFPFVAEPMDLGAYWKHRALPQAGLAIEEAAVLPEPVRTKLGFAGLFPGLPAATDLQRAADIVAIGSGPQLFVIEDLTGSGKTEAALTLAGRLLAAGQAEGIYVALPTTATADAMYGRVGRVYGRMFEPASRPSLVLAHSRRDLSRTFRQSVGGARIEAEAPYQADETGAAATCAAWLADSRKKALLAQVGVGTIDQALLAALNVRHQSLRALGLLGKVLIVDEVHACDAYMNRLLEQLLELHAAQGGSAILLSATLPLMTREKLVRAFTQGAGFEPPETIAQGYPQLLAVSGDACHVVPAEPPSWSRRTLEFRLLHDPEEALDWLVERAEAGAAVCWVRNTVRDAVEAYDELAGRLDPGRVTLFHARFVLGDRLRTEEEVLGRFGKESRAEERRGRVVVATQVIEQSLDLDFDEMLSDLAPIDLLLQRSGRLRRHPRDKEGNPLKIRDGADRRGPPVLYVLAPELVEDPPEAWIRSSLPGTSYVYPDHAELWRTARVCRDRPTARLPEDSRRLVEEVFGSASSLPLPSGLQRNAIEAEGQRRADASQGKANAITFSAGYGGGFDSWTDFEDTRTRLGEPTVTLCLARRDGEDLLPMAQDDDPRRAWALSEVSVRRSLVAAVPPQEDPALDAELKGAVKREPRLRRVLLLPLVPSADGWDGLVLDGEGNARTVRYTNGRGLEVESKNPA
ncbi:MAG: CRISPR-associated helicase Cas3' [Acidobacteria bacterium]|nr:CRISPR-associated helicase Cas3' [Acidobacteriota bacterium]